VAAQADFCRRQQHRRLTQQELRAHDANEHCGNKRLLLEPMYPYSFRTTQFFCTACTMWSTCVRHSTNVKWRRNYWCAGHASVTGSTSSVCYFSSSSIVVYSFCGVFEWPDVFLIFPHIILCLCTVYFSCFFGIFFVIIICLSVVSFLPKQKFKTTRNVDVKEIHVSGCWWHNEFLDSFEVIDN
jgi:hypothetical protein